MNRREVFALAPAALALGAVPAEAAVRDPHPGWLAEWIEARKAYSDNLTPDGDETDASEVAYARGIELGKLISATPAVAIAGIAAKLQWMLTDAEGDFGCAVHEIALTTAIDDLAGIEA